jgi:DNA segregation ATPase FtsK/SpoIIIE-like protein
LILDEFADRRADKKMRRSLERSMNRLSAKARGAGVDLVLATWRPEANVLAPLIRSILTSRICLRVASKQDSNLLLRTHDGPALLGRGDLLWDRGAGKLRLQCPWITFESVLFPTP